MSNGPCGRRHRPTGRLSRPLRSPYRSSAAISQCAFEGTVGDSIGKCRGAIFRRQRFGDREVVFRRLRHRIVFGQVRPGLVKVPWAEIEDIITLRLRFDPTVSTRRCAASGVYAQESKTHRISRPSSELKSSYRSARMTSASQGADRDAAPRDRIVTSCPAKAQAFAIAPPRNPVPPTTRHRILHCG